MSERFLSDEDLDLVNLSWKELLAWWDLWLHQAQATNELDEHLYSHGVFDVEPGWRQTSAGIVCVDVARDSPNGPRNKS